MGGQSPGSRVVSGQPGVVGQFLVGVLLVYGVFLLVEDIIARRKDKP